MKARVTAVEYALPPTRLTNETLDSEHPEWNVEKISRSTGIRNRNVATADLLTSELATRAALKLLAEQNVDAKDLDYILLCTQSPDFALPTTACIVQGQIGMRNDVGAMDITLGCSGFVYALALAKGLIETSQVRNVLVLTAETHSKFANPNDKATRPIFGDGAAAALVVGESGSTDYIAGVRLGTDGAGGPHLVVPSGALGDANMYSPGSAPLDRGLTSNGYDMYMNGMEIFNFTLRVVPACFDDVLAAAGVKMEDVDLFVFHQANGYLIEHLRKKLGIPSERFVVALEDYGNTGSSTIPIALVDALREGRIRKGDRILLMGFGVGLSWGGALITW